MTSYLNICVVSESVSQNYRANLPNLVGLRLVSRALEIGLLLNAIATENVVTSPRSLREAEVSKKRAEIVEADVGVGSPLKYCADELLMLAHGVILPELQRAIH
jgi:hypothetical protein